MEQQNQNGLRPEYDFESMKGGIRGKYYTQYREDPGILVGFVRTAGPSTPRPPTRKRVGKGSGRSGRDDKI